MEVRSASVDGSRRPLCRCFDGSAIACRGSAVRTPATAWSRFGCATGVGGVLAGFECSMLLPTHSMEIPVDLTAGQHLCGTPVVHDFPGPARPDDLLQW